MIAPRGDRTAGAVIGGLGGAVIGNQIDRPDADCAHAYGYYDRNSRWHVNDIDRANARGYYDRNGAWVDGAPNGYYDDDGQWVARVSGHYDDEGRWVAGQTTGAYDAHGHWMSGARSGHMDANGDWVADAQPGYYDSNHHWRTGSARGYYDTRGDWIGSTPSVAAYGVDSSYVGGEGHRTGDQYTGRVGSHWVDGYGRRCAWREVTYRDDDGYQAFKWVTDCRE